MLQLISRRSSGLELHVRHEPPLRWLGALLPLALSAMRRAWTARSDQRLLQELSDYHLRDIGISREQIPHIVRSGRDL